MGLGAVTMVTVDLAFNSCHPEASVSSNISMCGFKSKTVFLSETIERKRSTINNRMREAIYGGKRNETMDIGVGRVGGGTGPSCRLHNCLKASTRKPSCVSALPRMERMRSALSCVRRNAFVKRKHWES